MFFKVGIQVRRTIWAFVVAYMLGIHNFYRAEERAPDDMVKTIYTIEHNEVQEDGTPND